MHEATDSPIVLCTVNARYFHASVGLRYLFANLDELRDSARIVEFTLEQTGQQIVESLLSYRPRIIGLGVYIWNVTASTQIAQLLKSLAPDIVLVIGGPEVSHEYEQQTLFRLCDYLIPGPGDLAFVALCRDVLRGRTPGEKVQRPRSFELDDLQFPYPYYDSEDIAHRFIYVEASRGCPFRCEFCLSALDKNAKAFDLDLFLEHMGRLLDRGVRHFKFIDRTFNLKVRHSQAILEFFLARADDDLFLHFELIPDRLPDALKQIIQSFPTGALQFEIGIQTFDPEVQALISRRQNNRKACENLRWLLAETGAHIHADLIFGLPGEDLASFSRSFNRLFEIRPHEIQLGILKRLKGTPIVRHVDRFALVFNPEPPFNVLQTDRIDFTTMQRIARFARYWDMIANSGRFRETLKFLSANAFDDFLQLSDWLFQRTAKTHRIALPRLFDLLYEYLVDVRCDAAELPAREWLEADFKRGGFKGRPKFLIQNAGADNGGGELLANRRQRRHRR